MLNSASSRFWKLAEYKKTFGVVFVLIISASGYLYYDTCFQDVKVELASKPGQKTIITTRRLILKQADRGDRAMAFMIFQDPEIMSTLSDVSSFSDKEIDSMLNDWTENIRTMVPFSGYIAYEKNSNKFIGYISLDHAVLTRPDRAGISYALLKKFRGKGYGFEMAHAIMKHMLPKALKKGVNLNNNIPLRAITGTVNKNNPPSKKILEKLGFQFLHDTNSHRYIYNIKS